MDIKCFLNATTVDMSVETPSGKGRQNENFPVGSWLLARKFRRHVVSYYAFARAIDDIADSPFLAPDEKISRLEAFRKALAGKCSGQPAFGKAETLRNSMLETSVNPAHGLDLIIAFTQDATKNRYATWEELMNYCRYSAMPVGRYLIDLHGESKNCYEFSDALCSALQILNHLQDCKTDYLALNRVYLPLDWMEEYGSSIEEINSDSCSNELGGVLRRCLDETKPLLQTAAKLPQQIRRSRFAMEAHATVAVANRLWKELRKRDPLAERVVLSKVQYAQCVVSALFRGMGFLSHASRSS